MNRVPLPNPIPAEKCRVIWEILQEIYITVGDYFYSHNGQLGGEAGWGGSYIAFLSLSF